MEASQITTRTHMVLKTMWYVVTKNVWFVERAIFYRQG